MHDKDTVNIAWGQGGGIEWDMEQAQWMAFIIFFCCFMEPARALAEV